MNEEFSLNSNQIVTPISESQSVRIQCEMVLLGSKLITYKKEKTGRVACNQPVGTSLLGRLLLVDDRGVCAYPVSMHSNSIRACPRLYYAIS